MECLGRYAILVTTSVILSGGVKMKVEHGMFMEVCISCHDFCHTFRWCETPAGFPGKRGSQPELKMLSLLLNFN